MIIIIIIEIFIRHFQVVQFQEPSTLPMTTHLTKFLVSYICHYRRYFLSNFLTTLKWKNVQYEYDQL